MRKFLIIFICLLPSSAFTILATGNGFDENLETNNSDKKSFNLGNNNESSAYALNLRNTTEDELNSNGENYFQIEVVKTAIYRILVNAYNISLKMVLYNSVIDYDGEIYNLQNGTSLVTWVGELPIGDYTIRIYKYVTTSIQFSIVFTDEYDFSSYTGRMPVQYEMLGTLSNWDVELFEFTATQITVVKLTVSVGLPVSFSIDEPIGVSVNATWISPNSIYQLPIGTHNFAVVGGFGGIQDYLVYFIINPPDESDLNGYGTEMDPIVLESVKYQNQGNLIICMDDEDWFSTEVMEKGYFTIRVTIAALIVEVYFQGNRISTTDVTMDHSFDASPGLYLFRVAAPDSLYYVEYGIGFTLTPFEESMDSSMITSQSLIIPFPAITFLYTIWILVIIQICKKLYLFNFQENQKFANLGGKS